MKLVTEVDAPKIINNSFFLKKVEEFLDNIDNATYGTDCDSVKPFIELGLQNESLTLTGNFSLEYRWFNPDYHKMTFSMSPFNTTMEQINAYLTTISRFIALCHVERWDTFLACLMRRKKRTRVELHYPRAGLREIHFIDETIDHGPASIRLFIDDCNGFHIVMREQMTIYPTFAIPWDKAISVCREASSLLESQIVSLRLDQDNLREMQTSITKTLKQ